MKKAIEWAVLQWRFSIVAFLLLVVLGANALLTIPRSVDPHFPVPIVTVIANLPGAAAVDVEQSVLRPLERSASAIEGVKEIRAAATNGSATMAIEFDWDGDSDQYYDDVVRELSSIRSGLPESLQLSFRKTKTTEAAVKQFALTSADASWLRIAKYADDLQIALAKIDGVRDVRIVGLPEPQVEVLVEPDRLAQFGLSQQALVNEIAQAGQELPPGSVESGSRRFNVDAGGVFEDLEAVRSVSFTDRNGVPVELGNIAEVRWGTDEHIVQARLNGRRAIWLAVIQKDGVDAIRLKSKIMDELERQKRILPVDIELEDVFDQTRDIQKRMEELTRDFAIALILVLLFLVPIGLRPALAAMIAVPLSLACGLIIVDFAGYNLSQLTVAGFIVALGLLIDDAIVVTENIARHLRDAGDRLSATIAATQEIAAPVIGSTGVLFFAFLPLLFLPEGAGEFTRPFILAIIATVVASSFVALIIVPFLASRVLAREHSTEGTPILRWVLRSIDVYYRPLLKKALDYPKTTVWTAFVATSSMLLAVPAIGFSLFPYADTSFFRVTIEAEQGSGFANTNEISQQVVQIMKAEEAIALRAETVGGSNPQVFYNVTGDIKRPDYGEVLAVMAAWDGDESFAMVERLRKKFDQIPGAQIQVQLFQNGASSAPPIQFRVVGEDIEELTRLSGQVERILQSTDGTRDVVNPHAVKQIDLELEVDVGKAALLGVSGQNVRRALQRALKGQTASTLRDTEGDSYPVVVKVKGDTPPDFSVLERVYVTGRNGQQVQLAQISEFTLKNEPRQIRHHNLERTAVISSQVEYGFLPSEVSDAAESQISKIELPKGFRVDVGGEQEAISETFSGFVPALLLALFGICAILVLEFGKFREMLVALGVIPLGLFGGLLALLITGNSLSYMTVIGFIALIGIEIKNSILLVDFASRMRAEGKGLRDAVEQAGKVRFLPVLLTSITAVGSLIPLAVFGGALYSSLAWVIIGGLISSTILSRLVTPAMYMLIARNAGQ